MSELSVYKDYLKISSSSTSEDDLLTIMLDAAKDYVSRSTRWTFALTEFTENHQGNIRIIQPFNIPVIDLESITVDGIEQALDDYTVMGHDTDIVRTDNQKTAGSWIVLSYSAGIPLQDSNSDIKHLTYLVAVRFYENRLQARSLTALGQSVTFSDGSIEKAIISKYRRVLY